MNAIGMYMTGNSLQIFSIMMVFMLFKGPITALFQIQPTFAKLETDTNRTQMLAMGWDCCRTYHSMFSEVALGVLLTARTGPQDQIGWRGRRQGSHWRERTMCLHDFQNGSMIETQPNVDSCWLDTSDFNMFHHLSTKRH